jgi:hypothetical protein
VKDDRTLKTVAFYATIILKQVFEIECEDVGSAASGKGAALSSFTYVSAPTGSIKDGEFLDQLSGCKLLKKDSTSRS